MIITGLFGFVVRGRPSGAGLMLLSLGLIFNGPVVDPQSTIFGLERWHISHIFLAIWVLSMTKIVCEERQI